MKRENRKLGTIFSLLLVRGETSSRLSVAIYKESVLHHGVVARVPVILSENETKVKERVVWLYKCDCLSRFYGSKIDHKCVSNFIPMIGVGEEEYNYKLIDAFWFGKLGWFARVIIINPLHEKLPRLMFVVTCTCNCFDSSRVRNQWQVVKDLWNTEGLQIVGPIVEHASDGNSRRCQLMLKDYKGKARI